MYSSFVLAKKYFQYYLSASNSEGHGMHSPFVFDFILNVLNNKSNYDPPQEIENLRRELLTNKSTIEVEDLGAGSRTNQLRTKQISEIARTAIKPKKLAQVLYRLVKHYQPQIIIELGTSLGITTAYFSKANPSSEIITMEGSVSIAAIAKKNFEKLGCQNIKMHQGNFDALLPFVIAPLSAAPGIAYIDGNHRYEPTINYFNQLLAVCDNDTILVFDDIHWSAEMEKAWKEIQQHPSVQCTIDIFFLGFVFFRKEFKVKQNFKIRY